METPDFTRFAEAHRAYAESLFAKIRSLSASPAPNRGVTRFGYSEVEDRVLDALEEEGRALGLETSRDAAGNLLMRLPGRDRTLPGLFAAVTPTASWTAATSTGSRASPRRFSSCGICRRGASRPRATSS